MWKNNNGFLLMDAIAGLAILSISIMFIISMYSNIMIAHKNAELYIKVLTEFENNIYEGFVDEKLVIDGIEVEIISLNSGTYCVKYFDFNEVYIESCVTKPRFWERPNE